MKKVHDSFEIIAELLLGRGMSVLPKGDGRIEIPQHVVKMLGWNEKKELFFSLRPGVLVISCKPQADTHIGKVAVNMGRARVPLNILKAAGMNGDALMLIITGGEEIVLRPDIATSRDSFVNLVNQLDGDVLNSITRVLTADRSVVYNGPAPLVVEETYAEKFTNSGDRKKEEPFLILPNEHDVVVFRPVGLPFRFTGHWFPVSRELVWMKPRPSDDGWNFFYLIPGIRRMKGGTRTDDRYRFGFLLLNSMLYGRVSLIMRGARGMGRDLIFVYKPYATDLFAVHANPPEEISADVVKSAIEMCDDPEGFLKKVFREYDRNSDGGFFDVRSPTLYAKKLEKFLCTPKIG